MTSDSGPFVELSQPPAMRGKLPGIEAGRGVAAALVVLYHTSNHMGRNLGHAPLHGVAQFGHAGVDFFFVLSGFIIFFIHRGDLGRPDRFAHFAERRFTRVFPLYWCVLLLGLAIGLAAHASLPAPLGTVLYNLTLLPTTDEPLVGVAWTLQHELMFYAIFAVAVLWKRAGVVLMAAWFFAIVLHAVAGLPEVAGPFANRLLSLFNIQFFFGMFAAWLVAGGRLVRTKAALVAGIVSFAGTGIVEDCGWLDGYGHAARIGYGLSAMLLVIGLASVRLGEGAWSRGFAVLGTASYSIYLVHLTFIGVMYKITEFTGFFRAAPVPLTYVLMSASGILGGLIVSRFVEYPLMRILRSRFRGDRFPPNIARS